MHTNAKSPAAVVALSLAGLMGVLAAFAGGCNEQPAASTPDTQAAAPAVVTVASLVPGATDMLLAMGAGDRIVAVSSVEPARPQTDGLPRVGDYQYTDWERLAALRPDVMIVFAPESALAPMRQRAADLGIELINLRTDTITDVYLALGDLGKALQMPQAAVEAQHALRERLDEVRTRVLDRPPVKTLLVLDVEGRAVVGPGGFLDQLLSLAGGVNAAAPLGNAYPTVDPEGIAAMAPEAVVVLLPGAGDHQVAQAKQVWARMDSLPAVRSGRVHVLTAPSLLLSGTAMADTARRLAEVLHPLSSSEADPASTSQDAH